MPIVILDLEWNTAYSHRKQGFVNEIIEFGAVKLDDRLRQIDTFQQLVNTRLTRRLTGKVKDLTHLTLDQLREGIRFPEAMEAFGRFVGPDSLLLTWSTTDIRVMLDNCELFTEWQTIPGLTRYADLQWYVQEQLGLGHSSQMGLEAAAEQVDLSLEGVDRHRALDDSLVSAEILRRCYDPDRLQAMALDATLPSFYDRLTFKTCYIVNIKDPLIQPDDLRLKCDVCDAFARRTTKWKVHNHSFCADFHCRRCGRRFHGRVQFKKRYDELEIRTYRHPIEPDPAEEAPIEDPAPATAG